MVDTIDQVRDPRLNIKQLRTTINSFETLTEKSQGCLCRVAHGRKIGMVFDRITTVVMYSKQPLFYTTTLMREHDDWKLIPIQLNTDVNKVAHLEWLR